MELALVQVDSLLQRGRHLIVAVFAGHYAPPFLRLAFGAASPLEGFVAEGVSFAPSLTLGGRPIVGFCESAMQPRINAAGLTAKCYPRHEAIVVNYVFPIDGLYRAGGWFTPCRTDCM
jgi:hypothetical protein